MHLLSSSDKASSGSTENESLSARMENDKMPFPDTMYLI